MINEPRFCQWMNCYTLDIQIAHGWLDIKQNGAFSFLVSITFTFYVNVNDEFPWDHA